MIRVPRRRRAPPPFWSPGLGIVLVLATVLAAAAVLVVVLAPGPPGLPPYTYVNATLTIGGTSAFEDHDYFSLNTASPELNDPQVGSLVTATGIVDENSGYPAESVNQSANLQYSDTGTATPYTGENDSKFIALCEEVHCRASLPLPGEIDDPGAAAVTVRYVEHTLGFDPAYWEVGNEPASWTHFGIPWDQWRPTDHSTPTPLQFAQMVQRYVLAVRSVDPAAQILGIQSDAGSPSRADWFTSLMQIDGPNLSAVAYHSYPGGVGTPGESLSEFFATLSQPGSFPLNYPLTLSTVRSACASCATRLFVGEYNSARLGNLTAYASGYPEAPYIAAGLLEGLEENASQVTFYGLQPGGATGLLDSNGDPLPVYYDYATFFRNLALPWIETATVTGGPSGVYALASHNSSQVSELVVNTNTAVGLNLSFAPGAAWNGTAEVYLFGPRLSQPTAVPMTLAGLSKVQVPPEGILMIDGPSGSFGPLTLRSHVAPSGQIGAPHAVEGPFPGPAATVVPAGGVRTAASRSRDVS